ncbi:MAG: hypothetical protein WCO00_12040 [Rhodospirillaceae bacterium]
MKIKPYDSTPSRSDARADLVRQVPEALKPRTIAINAGPANTGATQITGKAA